MIYRAFAVLVSATLSTSCEQDIAFASIALTVREPQQQERFGSEALTGLQWTIDKEFRSSVSFAAGATVQTLDIDLGQTAHDVDVIAFVGNKDKAEAVGRASPFTLPPIDEASRAPAPALKAGVFLAQPSVPELLVSNTPAARSGTAACDSAAGKVLVVGGADNAYLLGGSLTVTDIVRDYDTRGFTVACDLRDGDDSAIAARGVCNRDNVGTYDVTVGLDSGNASNVTEVGELCDGFVRAVGDVVWIAGARFVALHDAATGALIARTNLSLSQTVRHALIDDVTLLVQGETDNGALATVAVRRSGDQLEEPVPLPLDRFFAADASGPSILFADGAVRVAVFDVVSGAVIFTSERASQLTIDAVRIVVISANDEDPAKERIVGLAADGTLQIEGEQAISTRRESMAVTFGDALLLFGGAEGHDVLVAPLSDFELKTLTTPPSDGAY